MKNKRILSLLLLALALVMLALSLTSCGASIEDVKLPKQTEANLKVNGYDTVNLEKDKVSELDVVKYFSNDSAADYFSGADAKKYLRYVVAGERKNDEIVICYCKSDSAKDTVVEKLNALKSPSSSRSISALSHSIASTTS